MEVEWNRYYNLARKTTKYVKLQEFQYKVLHRILPTNHLLYEMAKSRKKSKKQKENKREKIERKEITSPNCRLCGQDETLTHMLLYCPKVDKIWKWLQKAMYTITGKTMALYTENCVLDTIKEINQAN